LFSRFPPDEISFFTILSKPPFKGATFAASLYGGPVAYFTHNWAYEDGYAALARGSVTLGPDGYDVKRYSPYMWFADRAVNAAYQKPEYFLAKTLPVYELRQRLRPTHLADEAARRPRVGDVPLVRAIREGRTSYLHPVEVARDPSPLDRWSIVRLDWDFPPFLRPLQGGEFVALNAWSNGNETRVRVDYRYAHQEGLPEVGTRITLTAQSAQPHCGASEYNVALSAAAGGAHEFVLPPSFAETVRAEVQPATATKSGPVYRSRPLEIGSADRCRNSSAVSK
jgi:hypothetical protein